MRLTENNILRVSALEQNGIVYSWHVSMKSGKVADSRSYYTGDSEIEYPVFKLPVSIQNFVKKHQFEKQEITNKYGKPIPDFFRRIYT